MNEETTTTVATAEESSGVELVTPEAPKFILEILPTETGFDVKVGEGLTLTEAAQMFVRALIAEGKLTWNPYASELKAVEPVATSEGAA